MILKFSIVLSFLSLNLLAFSDHAPFEIKNIETIEISPEYSFAYDQEFAQKNVASVILETGKLIAFGKKVWTIIERSKPVSDVHAMKPISILPKESDQVDAMDLSGWSVPKVKSFQVIYRNGFGASVVKFKYHVIFQYGGRYMEKGSYLTGVNVVASDVSVSWGFEFKALSMLETISNIGSKESPIAAAQMSIEYKVKSVISSKETKQLFFVTGTGDIQRIYK